MSLTILAKSRSPLGLRRWLEVLWISWVALVATSGGDTISNRNLTLLALVGLDLGTELGDHRGEVVRRAAVAVDADRVQLDVGPLGLREQLGEAALFVWSGLLPHDANIAAHRAFVSGCEGPRHRGIV